MTAPRTYLDYLVDILAAIDDIEAFTRGLDEPSFTADRKTVYAVTRAIEIIGEAVKRISDVVQGRHPQVPWRPMARMWYAQVYILPWQESQVAAQRRGPPLAMRGGPYCPSTIRQQPWPAICGRS